jgi:hypothetical protein
MALSRLLLGAPLSEMAKAHCRSDHTTARQAVDRMARLLDAISLPKDANIAQWVNAALPALEVEIARRRSVFEGKQTARNRRGRFTGGP